MQWSDISFQPAPRILRQFAAIWIVFFGGLAAWQEFVRANHTVAIIAAIIAPIGVLGLLKPGLIRPVYVGAMILAFPIGWVISHVLLAIIFYGIFTPVGLIFKMIGRDLMNRAYDVQAKTYWTLKPVRSDARGYFRQF